MATINEQIQARLLAKEGVDLEYKSAKGGFPKSFWETFSAFANSNGGIIVLGVKEKDGKLVPDGMTEEQSTAFRKQFWDDAHNKSCVSIPLLVESDIEEIYTDGGQRLIAFHVPRAPYDLRPVHLSLTPFGHTYKRRHEGDYVCTDDEVRQMFSDANNLKSSADSRILRGYNIEDIDMNTLRQYRRIYEIRHEGHPWNNDSDMQFLEHIGAYRKDRATSTEGFTMAGILMLGKGDSITDPECCPYFFLDYRERLSEDRGVRWTNRIYPDGTWEPNLYQFYTRVLPLMQHALPVPFRLNESQVRMETTAAHIALREAFVNCMVHCAYTVMGNIAIDRYPDRIVMSNPGTMLISMEEYEEGGHSVCRNPILQKMFVFLGIGERGGSGADIIAKGWLDNGWKPLPTMTEHAMPDRVETILPLPHHLEESGGERGWADRRGDDARVKLEYIRQLIGAKLSGDSSGNTDALSGISNDLSGNPNELSGDFSRNTDTLSGNNVFLERMASIVLFIFEHPHSSNGQVAEAMQKSKETTKRYLQKLAGLGMVVPEGGNRNRTYIVSPGVGRAVAVVRR